MGKHDEIGQLPPVECTYADCYKRFHSVKEMKRHKLTEPEHNYCKKCDVDCADWEDLTQHKVDAMRPWLEGRITNTEEEHPKHVACEFCGMDFKTFGARKMHRNQQHPADQEIICPGCSRIFVRAAHLVAHLEQDKCENIRQSDFEGSIQQKHVVSQLMQAPDQVAERLAINPAFGQSPEFSAMITDDPTPSEAEEGGVGLLDQDDEAQMGGGVPLQATSKSAGGYHRAQLTRENLETWPRMPGQPPSKLTEAMRAMAIGSRSQSVAETDTSANQCASEITSRRGGIKIYTDSGTSPTSPTYAPSTENTDDTESVVSTATMGTSINQGAWAMGNTSQHLFKGAAPTPPKPGDWTGILEQRAFEVDQSTNLFHSRFWDPNSREYNIERFFNPVIDRFCCPFPDCDGEYATPGDMEYHLQNSHMKKNFRCPLCYKIYKTPSALVAHSEAEGKCRVKQSVHYKKLLDEASGGFLKVKYLEQPKIYPQEKGKGKAGESNGVMGAKFTAKMPDEY